jgi:hypothetical protein
VETLIERYENEPILICRGSATETEVRAINRWRHGARPSIWSADRFLTKLANPQHIDQYFRFCESTNRLAWARGFAPAWVVAGDRTWVNEPIEDQRPGRRPAATEPRAKAARVQTLLARLNGPNA